MMVMMTNKNTCKYCDKPFRFSKGNLYELIPNYFRGEAYPRRVAELGGICDGFSTNKRLVSYEETKDTVDTLYANFGDLVLILDNYCSCEAAGHIKMRALYKNNIILVSDFDIK